MSHEECSEQICLPVRPLSRVARLRSRSSPISGVLERTGHITGSSISSIYLIEEDVVASEREERPALRFSDTSTAGARAVPVLYLLFHFHCGEFMPDLLSGATAGPRSRRLKAAGLLSCLLVVLSTCAIVTFQLAGVLKRKYTARSYPPGAPRTILSVGVDPLRRTHILVCSAVTPGQDWFACGCVFALPLCDLGKLYMPFFLSS